MSKPLISFIVLNWNGLEDTKTCIKSIHDLNYPNKELVIVDNGSVDGSKEYLGSLKEIVFVDLPENTGFTGGHIAGRKVASGEYIALINNDLVLDANWAKACMETFERHEDAALVGGKAYQWNENSKAHDTSNDFYAYQEVDPGTGYTRTLLVGEEEISVDSISGAALLIKQDTLNDVGYLDDLFFAYYEETDLIARLMRAGYRAYYNPLAHTWHKIAASSGGDSSFYLYMMHRNRYVFGYKNIDDLYLKRFRHNYRNEAFSSALRYLRNTKNIDAVCRIKAYRWVQKNKSLLHSRRHEVQALGDSYVSRLRAEEHNDVTVVIPCYNYGEYVAEAIDSVLNQTVKPKRIIVIDDGSTDNSRSVINTYKENPLVEIIHKPNGGVIETKNLGIKLSQTYWTLFLDADDRIAATFLEKTLDASSNGSKDIVYTDMRLFGTVEDVFRARPFSTHTLLRSNYINNSALIKTTLLKQVGGYKPEMNHGLEDWELYITLVEAGAKPQYLGLSLMEYRQHPDELGRNKSGGNVKEKRLVKQIRSLHRGFYRRNGFYTAIILRGIILLSYLFRYPGLILVLLKSVPRGVERGMSHIYNQGMSYIQKKTDISL